MRWKTVKLAVFVLLILCFLAFGVGICLQSSTVPAFYPQTRQQEVCILDAGHGGADGGAVSKSGTIESGINLAIVRKLNALCGLYGVPVKLTRKDENSIHDSSASTLREQKRSDLKNRVAIINGVENGCLISVHQNSSSGKKSGGTQVFYRSAESQPWAVYTQQLFVQALDPSNQREAAKISDSVYLMKNIHCPAILVECGFLSNAADEALLVDDGYQVKLAAVLLSSFLTRDKAEP